MIQNYGLYGGLKDSNLTPNNNVPYVAVRVLDIILDDKHPSWSKYGGWDGLGIIKYIPYYSNLTDADISINIAKPLFTNVKNYPLLQEITYVISLPDPSTAQNPNFSSYYYLNTVNIWNHPHHNAFPNINYNKLPSATKLDYREIESGLVKNEIKQDQKLFSLGSTFKEKGNIKPLLPFEGDIIHEGRFGQSIRFSSTVENKNPWSYQGEQGNPITIIRNGQDKNLDKKGWVPTIENINEDASSVYLCDGQAIPIQVASFNLKSFGSILQKVEYPIITISDSPIQSNSEESDVDEESSEIEMVPETYNKDIIMNESAQSKNEKGEYALYQSGKLIGYSPISFINGVRVATKYESYAKLVIEAAKKEGISIKINSGLRTFDEQLNLRKQNVKDKTKVNDQKILLDAPSSAFLPQTGRPGYSNHQNGRAFDFNTAVPAVYKWLVKNGLKYGFVRTVSSERWHWEYIPTSTQFAYVIKEHPTWDKLV